VVELRGSRPLVSPEIEREILDARLIAQSRKRDTMAFQKPQRIANLTVSARTIRVAHDQAEPRVGVLERIASRTPHLTFAPDGARLEVASREKLSHVETPARYSQNTSHVLWPSPS
jgi:hypothetical protein